MYPQIRLTGQRLKELVSLLESELHCNCDLDNWQPEKSIGHSQVCRIYRRIKAIERGDAQLPNTASKQS